MFPWLLRSYTTGRIHVANGDRASVIDDSNESDVSLLNPNETSDSAVIDFVALPPADRITRASRQSTVMPRVETNAQQVEVGSTMDVNRGLDDQQDRRRRRHQHRHRSSGVRRHDRSHRVKLNEKNVLSSIFNLIVVVLISVALFEPRWFHIQGGLCSDGKNAVHYLGIKTFFGLGSSHEDPFNYGNWQVLIHCVTYEVVAVMRVIIALCFVVLTSSLAACVLDIVGSSKVVLKVLRYTASLPILSVCVSIVISGMCYLVTEKLTAYYEAHRILEGSRVLVEFDIGFYMITAAGAMSVIAVGSTLMQEYSANSPCGPGTSRCWSRESSATSAWESADRPLDQQHLLNTDVCPLTLAAVGPYPQPAHRAPPPYRP